MELEVEDRRCIRWLRLNRTEKLNALSPEIRRGLASALTEAEADDAVRCIVIVGTGRAFCAGGDVSGGMGSRTPEQTARRMFISAALINQIVAVHKPTIAAVNGLAAGAGAGLALACDITLIAESAWMSFIFVERGLVPDFASTYFLPRVVGVGRAKELMLTGRRITAEEAVHYGIAVKVVPDDGFQDCVQNYAEGLASGAVGVMPLIRRMVNHSMENDFRATLEREALNQALASSRDEHKQAVQAFKDSRAARR
jgi:2-(1,2-epoxy-1,2-dihydrophenyl)acetyl-CoA isomerase